MGSPYSTHYYESIRDSAASSAREVTPQVIRFFRPRAVIDVGCGVGAWAHSYSVSGCDVTGVDGFDVQISQLAIPADRFVRHDLEKPLNVGRRFDLVNCLEVAEHLSPGRAGTFVADLCGLADIVVFSAAVPGQGGAHHVNEQWPGYWISKFAALGFTALDCFRPALWDNNQVAYWYAQNMLAFVRQSRLGEFPDAQAAVRTGPAAIVHPRAFVRATVPGEMTPAMLARVARALPGFPAKIIRHLRG